MTSPRQNAMARAIKRNDFERVALALVLALAAAARTAPPGTIDDLLAMLSTEEAADDPPRR